MKALIFFALSLTAFNIFAGERDDVQLFFEKTVSANGAQCTRSGDEKYFCSVMSTGQGCADGKVFMATASIKYNSEAINYGSDGSSHWRLGSFVKTFCVNSQISR
jgi:hypothetical protein